MAQTVYNDKPAIAYAGLLADIGPKFVSTGINGEAAAIPFGLGLIKGAADGQYRLPSAGTDKIIGIGLHSHDVNTIGATGWATDAGIPAGDDFNVLEEGRCYVKVEEAVVQGDPVYVRYAAGAGGTQRGAFRRSTVLNEVLLVKGATYESDAAAGGFAIVAFSRVTNLVP